MKTTTPEERRLENAARRQRHARRVQARTEGRMLPTARVEVAAAREHIQSLLDVQWGVPAIAAAAGIRESTARRILNGGQKLITVFAQDALLAVRAEDLHRHAPHVPLRLAEQMIRSMQAQGWSLGWQADQLGRDKATIKNVVYRTGPWVTKALYEDLKALYDRVGSSTGPSALSRSCARRDGWLASGYYDDDGRLVPAWIRDEDLAGLTAPWADQERARRRFNAPLVRRQERREAKARERLEVIRLSLEGFGTDTIAERMGFDGNIVYRYRTEAGLKFYRDDGDGKSLPRPGWEEQAAEARRILFEHFADCTSDPFITARMLGMMPHRKWDFDRQPASGAAEAASVAEAS